MSKVKMKVAAVICTLMLFILCGCSDEGENYKEQLPGIWINENRLHIFTLYDDGTCEITGEYGTGTWSIVNDNVLKVTNFYGESETYSIESIEDGCMTFSNNDLLYRFD